MFWNLTTLGFGVDFFGHQTIEEYFILRPKTFFGIFSLFKVCKPLRLYLRKDFAPFVVMQNLFPHPICKLFVKSYTEVNFKFTMHYLLGRGTDILKVTWNHRWYNINSILNKKYCIVGQHLNISGLLGMSLNNDYKYWSYVNNILRLRSLYFTSSLYKLHVICKLHMTYGYLILFVSYFPYTAHQFNAHVRLLWDDKLHIWQMEVWTMSYDVPSCRGSSSSFEKRRSFF